MLPMTVQLTPYENLAACFCRNKATSSGKLLRSQLTERMERRDVKLSAWPTTAMNCTSLSERRLSFDAV